MQQHIFRKPAAFILAAALALTAAGCGASSSKDASAESGEKTTAAAENTNTSSVSGGADASAEEGNAEGSVAGDIVGSIEDFAHSAAGYDPITPVPVTATPTPAPTPAAEPVSVNFLCGGDNLIHSSLIDCGLGRGGDWNYMYDLYRRYIAETGSTYVKSGEVYHGKKLGRWVRTQKERFQKGVIPQEQISLLLEINKDFFS